jgi:hypothetical protein
MTQAGHRLNLHHFDAPFVQPHDLLAPLVQLLQCLVSCVFFFHDLNMGQSPEIQDFNGPNLS